MTFKPLHCWDCGTKVLAPLIGSDGDFKPLPHYRHVKFALKGGAYCESPFCDKCADKPWPPSRLHEFEIAVNAVRPPDDPIHILRHEGAKVLPTAPVKIVQ